MARDKDEVPEQDNEKDKSGFMGLGSPEEFEKEFNNDPLSLIIYLINATPGSNEAILAYLIYAMPASGLINKEQLKVIGLEDEIIGTISDIIKNNDTFDDFESDLQVRYAIKEYDRVVMDIMIKNSLNVSMFELFRQELAKFAAIKPIADINEAFELYSISEVDALSKYKLVQ